MARSKTKLADYHAKRDFGKTPEPAGGTKGASDSGWMYCVQKHDARNLHYDLRLELDGVLKSWAVPKGPSLDPAVKPLAVRTEDHPIEYGDFEGVIPKGQYGGGTVMLWDIGTWEPIGDPHEGLEKGDLKFRLHGGKLSGEFVLARMKTGDDPHGKNWLLIKKNDADARAMDRYDILVEEPDSVATSRSLAEIEDDHDLVWTDGKAVSQSSTKQRASTGSLISNPLSPASLTRAARVDEQPEILKPQLATPAPLAPDGDDWVHEIKLDGYRIVCHLERGRVRLRTRAGNDWTSSFPSVVRALERLPCRRGILDGEVVILDENGISNFGAMQNAIRNPRSPFVYYLFDLLHLDGYDLTKSPLTERKALLKRVLDAAPGAEPVVRLSDHIVGNGPLVVEQARQSGGVEGIICKRVTSRYSSKRSDSWLKVKFVERSEYVIIGYSDPEGGRVGLGALALAEYDDDGNLVYRGRVGTGFSDAVLLRLREILEPMRAAVPELINPPTGAEARVNWVAPKLSCEVTYASITGDGILRHPVYHGLRDDKPLESTPEREVAASKAKSAVVRAPQAPDDETISGVRVSHPNRIVYPDQRITKREVAHHYLRVAERMLPHVVDRPISIVRCPKGVHHEHFFQRHLAEGMPKAIDSVLIEQEKETKNHLVIHDVEGLVSLVQFGTLEVHSWGCKVDRLDRPDHLILDLDPDDGVPLTSIIDAALFLRDLLEHAGLASVVKTSGGKGFHIGIPIARRTAWPDATEFARLVAERAEELAPSLFTASMAKRLRTDKIFIDYLRNMDGNTSVAPYSTRARPNAAVSLPLPWEALKDKPRPDSFTLRDVPVSGPDHWSLDTTQSISAKVIKKLQGG